MKEDVHAFTSTKSKKNPKHLYKYIQKAGQFAKEKDNLRFVFIHIYHEIFEIGTYIYIQKALHFALRDNFRCKKPETPKKQDNLRHVFYIQKA